MKSIIRQLFFDEELVNRIREKKVNKAFLYNQVINGRITLQEYLAALKNKR